MPTGAQVLAFLREKNLCHIAHNVHMEPNGMITAAACVAGSCYLGRNVYLAPGARTMDNIRVGDNALVGLGAVVLKDVPENKVVAGVPARVIRDRT